MTEINLTRGPIGLTRIASLKTKACDSTDQAVLQSSYTGRVQILNGGPIRGMCPVISAGKEENIFFKSRCKKLLFNFESFLTLTLPDLRGEGGFEQIPRRFSSITFDRDKILKRKFG